MSGTRRPTAMSNPWGDDAPDRNLANDDASGIGRTSVVGCFPGGRTTAGVKDLSGNTWE